MRKVLGTCAVALLMLGFASTASADLVFTTNIQISGTGLGAVNTLVTVHDPGGPGNQNGTESGCITQTGAFSPCLSNVNNTIEGGDNTALNQTFDLSTSANFAAVVNIAETGQDLTVLLTGLYLQFCVPGTNTCHTAFYNGPDKTLTQGGSEGTGLGNSGFTFALDAAEFATVQALGPIVRVAGGLQFGNGSTNDGNDTLHVIQLQGNTPIPEPVSLALFGLGLSSAGFMTRRRMKR